VITLGEAFVLLSGGGGGLFVGISADAGFFCKITLFFAGWADHQYLLVVVRSDYFCLVLDLLFTFRDSRMMVVKESSGALNVVQAYRRSPGLSLDAGACGCPWCWQLLITACGRFCYRIPSFNWANWGRRRYADAAEGDSPLGRHCCLPWYDHLPPGSGPPRTPYGGAGGHNSATIQPRSTGSGRYRGSAPFDDLQLTVESGDLPGLWGLRGSG